MILYFIRKEIDAIKEGKNIYLKGKKVNLLTKERKNLGEKIIIILRKQQFCKRDFSGCSFLFFYIFIILRKNDQSYFPYLSFFSFFHFKLNTSKLSKPTIL